MGFLKVIRKIVTVIVVCLVVALAYPLREGKSLRDATSDEITKQIPYALDILAARHPIRVGLFRSLFNDQGAVDGAVENYVRSNMDQKMSVVNCYLAYYVVVFDKDDVRKGMADSLEKQFGLV